MATLSETTHSTHTMDTARRARKSAPTLSTIWTEFAAITVRAFTPGIIEQLRQVACAHGDFDAQTHLPMLGSIVVNHVRLALEKESNEKENDAHTQRRRHSNAQKLDIRALEASRTHESVSISTLNICRQRNQSASQRIRSETDAPLPRRRSSYRELAYHAVRLRKIIPAATNDEPQSPVLAGDEPPKRERRLSIRLSKTQEGCDVAFRKSKSAFPLPERRERCETSTTRLSNEEQGDTTSVGRSEGVVPFPRARAAANIRPASLKNCQQGEEGDGARRVACRLKATDATANTVQTRVGHLGRLGHLRKQRTEKWNMGKK